MNWVQWVIIVDLIISGLAVFVRGIIGGTRTYTAFDAFFGAIEVALLVWAVSSL